MLVFFLGGSNRSASYVFAFILFLAAAFFLVAGNKLFFAVYFFNNGLVSVEPCVLALESKYVALENNLILFFLPIHKISSWFCLPRFISF